MTEPFRAGPDSEAAVSARGGLAVTPALPRVALTPSQRRVAAGVAAGLTNKEVAFQLDISPSTVKAHLMAIYRETGIDSRHDLVQWWLRLTGAPQVPMLTVTDVAQHLSCHRNTVKRIPADQLPYVRVTGRGDRRYRSEDVARYLDRMTVRR